MKIKNVVKSALVFICGVAAVVGLLVYSSDMIINFGIVIYRILMIAAIVVAIAGALFTGIPVIKYVTERNKKLQEEAKKKAEEEELIRRKKEDVRGLVNQLIIDEPDFAEPGHVLLKYMNQMDEFVERNDKLFTINDMKEFEGMREIISQAKNALYHNCRGAVNLFVALESSGEFKAEFDKVIEENEELIKNSQNFLLELARYTNEQNEDTDAVTLVQDYASAISQSLRHTYN